MAEVIITFKIMPESPDVDLAVIEEAAKEKIIGAGGRIGPVEIQPVAFGLKALMITCGRDEAKGGTDDLEAELSAIEGVNSVQIAAVGRALG